VISYKEATPVQELQERILAEGKNLGRGILKIDSILNHQMDTALMVSMGREIARLFAGEKIDRILTAEVSGIGPALMAGVELKVPVVYARKHRPITMSEPIFIQTAPSHTKGHEVQLMVSPEFLHAGERVLIVDDFLATGKTIYALSQIVRQAKAELVGVVCVVEKTFEGGRALLTELDVRIESLAIITSMEDNKIVFAD
jgi:xanthine phosphoribosyltransferase